jgi:hypothetical protein
LLLKIAAQDDDVAPKNTIVAKAGKMITIFMLIIKGVAQFTFSFPFDTREEEVSTRLLWEENSWLSNQTSA